MTTPALAVVRHEWEDGYRRLQAEAAEPRRYERLHAQVDALMDELRRRVGDVFTLSQLAAAYPDADDWGRETLADRTGFPGWSRTVSVAIAAAFHLFSRGATDYTP